MCINNINISAWILHKKYMYSKIVFIFNAFQLIFKLFSFHFSYYSFIHAFSCRYIEKFTYSMEGNIMCCSLLCIIRVINKRREFKMAVFEYEQIVKVYYFKFTFHFWNNIDSALFKRNSLISPERKTVSKTNELVHELIVCMTILNLLCSSSLVLFRYRKKKLTYNESCLFSPHHFYSNTFWEL